MRCVERAATDGEAAGAKQLRQARSDLTRLEEARQEALMLQAGLQSRVQELEATSGGMATRLDHLASERDAAQAGRELEREEAELARQKLSDETHDLLGKVRPL